jgi:hypothetical protein
LEYADGCVYEGQWRNDMMNGSGYFKHFSGYSYDGLFENDLPSKMPTKLTVAVECCNFDKTEKVFELVEGSANQFKVTVKTVNDDGKVFLGKKKNFIFIDSVRIIRD